MINIIGNAIGAGQSKASPDFIMEVDTTIVGATPDNQFTIATQGADVFQGNNFNVKTSDGQEFNNITANSLVITFPSPGIYTIKISGKFSGTKYGSSNDGKKIIDIKNWGDWEALQWARARGSFRECDSLTTFSASDAPYLGGLDSQGLAEMFWGCDNLNADFSKWDVGSIQNFGSTFARCTVFNNPSLNNWDMSSATQISYMFQEADAFNQDLSAWDVSNVTSMIGVFDGANAFNGDVSTWNTSSLTGSLFRIFNRTSFNGDLSNWDVSGVTSFSNAFAFSPFNSASISNWNVGVNCTSLDGMFRGSQFNQDISSWDTSNVQIFKYTFDSCPFNNSSISNWDTSSATDMSYMFYNNDFFNQDIGSWDVSNVTTMQGMFQDRGNVSTSNLNISNWETTSLTNTFQMFRGSGGNTTDLSNWDMSNVTEARQMFEFGGMTFDPSRWNIQGAVNLQSIFNGAQNTSGVVGLWTFNNWNISQAISITNFLGANVITTAAYDATLIAWAAQVPTTALTLNVNSTQYTLGGEAEAARTALINTYGWTISDGGGTAFVPLEYRFTPRGATFYHTIRTNPALTYNYDVLVSTGESFTNQTGDLTMNFADNASRTLQITGTFPNLYAAYPDQSANSITEIISFGSQPFRRATEMFRQTPSITAWPTEGPNLHLCTDATNIFYFTTIPANNYLENWNVHLISNFNGAFRSTSIQNVNVTSWDVGNATALLRFFATGSGFATSPTDVTGWNVRNCTNFQEMFSFNVDFNQDISNWDMRSAQNLQSFLYSTSGNLTFNQPIGKWNTSSVTNILGTLRGAAAFDQDLSNWDISSLTNSQTTLFLEFGQLSRANYDKLLISWAAQSAPLNYNIHFGASQYTLGGAAEAARNTLINTYGWTITDGGGVIAPFQFTVDTTLGDGLPEYEIRTRSDIQTYNYDITTSDGQSITGVTGNYNIIFPSAGQYTVEIRGTFPWHWGFGAPDRLKLIDVSEWGSIAWSSMERMFYQHSNLTVSATDAPDLSAVTNMAQMFQQTAITNNDFTSWDTSNITDMGSLFRGAPFNGDISTWNTSNVTNMAGTFATGSFNGDITAWDVSSVTTFNECFLNASSFNQDISGWNTSSATSFRWMFYNAHQFNADISGWNTSSLTNLDLTFRYAVMFDQDISGWNISGVTIFNNLLLNTVGPSQANYDAILIGWEAQAPQTGKTISFGEATYTPGGAAEAARTSLINTYGWTITDGGPRAAQTSGFLLDDYPGAAAAYSFRQLSSSTSVVAQLSTTISSTDFRDFTATEMQRRLHQILGYRYIRVFYDQSGNGRHADNGSMYISNAADGLLNGKPVAQTYSGFGTMFTPQQALAIDNSSIFFVGKIYAYSTQTLMSYGSSTAGTGAARVVSYTWPGTLRFATSGNNFNAAMTLDGTNLSLTYGIQNGQSIDLYHDGQSVSGSLPSAPSTATNEYFGLTNYYPTTSGGPSNSAEFVFYPIDLSASNIAGVQNNINEFYLL